MTRRSRSANRRLIVGKVVSLAVLVPAIGVLGSMIVLAEDGAGKYRPTTQERNACLADFRRLCPGVKLGGGRVRKCFEDHFPQLSPLCQKAVEASRADGR